MADAKMEKAALDRIGTLDDPARLRAMLANARRLKNPAVERAAFQRLCFIQAEASPGTVEHEVWQSIHALEEMLAAERGKTVRLSRTRQKIGRDGEVKTVADLSRKPAESAGFRDLIALGHPELTFEAVVLRHPGRFSEDVVDAARQRLASQGLDVAAFAEAPKGTQHG